MRRVINRSPQELHSEEPLLIEYPAATYNGKVGDNTNDWGEDHDVVYYNEKQ